MSIGVRAELDYNYGRHITIGDEAIIVSGAQILCHDASSCKRIGATRVAPVTIGKRAFIGARALILPGVAVGDDAVVGAGAVVSQDVPTGTIVIGNPARAVGRTRDLDAKRLDRMASCPVLDQVAYFRRSSASNSNLVGQTAGPVPRGEYYLARPDVAARHQKRD